MSGEGRVPAGAPPARAPLGPCSRSSHFRDAAVSESSGDGPPGASELPTGGGFETLRSPGGALLILRRGLATRLPDGVLEDPERILAERGGRGTGRGALARITPRGGPTLVLKKYRHGGALRAVLPDLFAGTRRMLDDLAASERARAAGVPCAAVAGLILARRAGPLWRGYLLTEEIQEAVTLDRALPAGGRDLAAAAVRPVRRLHDAGILHRDLNLRNLLARNGEVFVIDLDGARLVPSPTPAQRFANLSRLDRSYEKIFRGRGPLAHDDRRALLDVYSATDAALRRELAGRIGAHKRSLARHRRLWR